MTNQIENYFEFKSKIEEFMEEKNLTETQLNTILYTGSKGLEKVSIGEIPRRRKSMSLVSTETSKLWKKGIINKEMPQDNQRIRMISLREEGKEIYNQAKKIIEDYY